MILYKNSSESIPEEVQIVLDKKDEEQQLLSVSNSSEGVNANYGAIAIGTLCILGTFATFSEGTMVLFSHENKSDRYLAAVGEELNICNPETTYEGFERVAGDFFAWSSGLLYFFGRIPQVVHNYQRKSVDGLSPFMFLCSFLANVFYGFSIVLSKVDWTTAAFWENVFPYILGSWFTLLWPGIVLIQYFWYSRKSRQRQPLEID